jgi:hypothetical protein
MKFYNLGILEVMSEDVRVERSKNPNVPANYRFDYRVMYDEAIKYAEELGPGWRLPTIKEIIFLKQYYDMRIMGFDDGGYWVDPNGYPEQISEDWAIKFYFPTSRRGGVPKNQRERARLVRSI